MHYFFAHGGKNRVPLLNAYLDDENLSVAWAALLGVGIVKGINTVSRQILANVLVGWFLTPVAASFVAIILYFAIHL